MAAEQHVTRGASAQSADPRYRFKDGIWPVVCELKGWRTMSAAAADLGVRDTTIARAVTGETYPGEVLMARVMNALPRTWKHDHVFEIVDAAEQVSA